MSSSPSSASGVARRTRSASPVASWGPPIPPRRSSSLSRRTPLGFAAVVGLAAAALQSGAGSTTITPLGLASAVVSGVLYYAAAYWFYLSALRTVPASLAASAFYLIPVFGVAAGSLLLGDRLAPVQWLGVGIVAVAVALIASGRVQARSPGRQSRSRPDPPASRSPRQRPASRSGGTSQRSVPDAWLIGRTVSIRTSAPFLSAIDGARGPCREPLKIRVVADEHRPFRLLRVEQDCLERDCVDAAREALVDRDLDAERVRDDLRGLASPGLGRRDIASGLKPPSARNRPSRFACFSPLPDSGRTSSDPATPGSPASACRGEELGPVAVGRRHAPRIRHECGSRSRRASEMNWVIRVASNVSVRSNAASRCSSVPSTLAGSS